MLERSHWLIVDEVPVFTREFGPAAESVEPPIVLVHGFAISGRSMTPVARELAREHRCLVPDLPGHGSSHAPADGVTVDALTRWLSVYLDHAGVNRVVLMGSSAGSIVALQFAALHPERVQALVLVSPAGGKASQPLPIMAAQLLVDGFREPPSLLAIAAQDYLRFGVPAGFRYLRGMRSFRFGPTFDRTGLPALVVAGSRDPLVDLALVHETARRHGGVSVATIDGAAHAPNYSHPVELARATRGFLNGSLASSDGIEVVDYPAVAPRHRIEAAT